MKKLNTSILILASFLITACFEKEVKTVEWYKEHTKERDELLAQCKNNPGQLEHDPNCKNAFASRKVEGMGEMQGISIKK